jgi:hypothetical protein
MTLEEAIEKARADYAAVVGTVIEVPSLCGYSGEDSCDAMSVVISTS